MAYDKTYDEYIKRTQGQGAQMSKDLFENKRREMLDTQMAEEKLQRDVDMGEARKIRYSMDNQGTASDQFNGMPQQKIGVVGGVVGGGGTIQQLQQQIADAQKRNEISNLEQLYQKNVGGLTAERQKVDPLYAGQTRQAVAQGAMQKKSFSDFLAEKGLSASGQAGQGEISQNVAMQGQLGDIQARRGEAMSDIERRLTDVTRARDFGIAEAGTKADRYLAEQQLSGALRQQELDRADQLRREDIAREQSRYNQEISRADTLRQQAIAREDELRQQGFSREDAQNQAELERRQKEQERSDFAAIINPTEDLTAKIQELERQGVPQDDYRIIEYKKARTNKIINMNQANFERELANIKSEDERQETALEYAWKKFNSGLPADAVTATLLNIKPGTVIPEQKIKEAQLALDKIKANKTSSTASEKKQETENYRAFELDYSNLIANDPARATNLVKANREELIRQKGLTVYNRLLNQAEQATTERLKQQQKSQYNFYPQP